MALMGDKSNHLILRLLTNDSCVFHRRVPTVRKNIYLKNIRLVSEWIAMAV